MLIDPLQRQKRPLVFFTQSHIPGDLGNKRKYPLTHFEYLAVRVIPPSEQLCPGYWNHIIFHGILPPRWTLLDLSVTRDGGVGSILHNRYHALGCCLFVKKQIFHNGTTRFCQGKKNRKIVLNLMLIAQKKRLDTLNAMQRTSALCKVPFLKSCQFFFAITMYRRIDNIA